MGPLTGCGKKVISWLPVLVIYDRVEDPVRQQDDKISGVGIQSCEKISV